MPRATASTEAILAAARELVAAAAPLIAERGLTLVGFAVSNIDRDGAAAAGAAVRRPSTRPGDASTRRSTRCAGATAIGASRRGVLLGRDPGLEMPHLPD